MLHVDEREFVGRADALAVVQDRLAQAAQGASSLLWVEATAGSGKTSFVRAVTSQVPAGTTVRMVQAEELTQDTPFALVAQLGLATGGSALPTGLAVLDLLSGDDAASLLVVEDLHWADEESRQALLAAAHRLDEDGVVVLITTRPPQFADAERWTRIVDERELALRVELSPFTTDEIIVLAERRGLRLSPRRAAEVHTHTLGQPLHVQMVLDELSQSEASAPGVPLPIPRSVAATSVARIQVLSEPAVRLAEALAVLNQRTTLATAAAVGDVDRPSAAVEELLPTGLVTWAPREPGTPVAFAHPLFRLAVYDSLAPTQRQRLHRSAARFVDGPSALAHRAAAVDGFDDGLADELDAAAQADAAAGIRAPAAALLLSAHSMTSVRDLAESRLIRAALLLLDEDLPDRVAPLVAQIRGARPSGRRSLVLGILAWQRGDAQVAETWLTEATNEDDPDIAAAAWSHLSYLWAFHERYAEAVRAGETIIALHPTDPAIEREGWRAIAVGDAVLHGPPHALDRLAARLPDDPEQVSDDDAGLLTWRAMIRCYDGQVDAPLADLRRIARAHGRRPDPRVHLHLCQTLQRAGAWDEAITQGRIARSLGADASMLWVLAQAEAALARVLFERGDEEADLRVAAAEAAVDRAPTLEARATIDLTKAAGAHARSDPAAVAALLAPFSEYASAADPNRLIPLEWWPSLIIAHIALGDLEAAERERKRFHLASELRSIDRAPTLSHVDARVSWAMGDAAALEHYEAAVTETGRTMPALERAETHQAYGEALHGSGDRKAAMEHLQAADARYLRLGAEPFRQRLAPILAKLGSRPVRSREERRVTLTDRERDVAALVATGMTNKEVAASLYVSAKAVEYHLGNIFGKLGLSSRHELRQRRDEFALATT